MGGLITFAKPQDLPEGASPRNWNVDYEVGSVLSRPGLSSFFTYTSTLNITSYELRYGVATFTYSGIEPTINEEFLLNGFTGPQAYLNGLQVFVISAGMTTFTADISHVDDGPVSGLSATATSTSGLFIGPNVGGKVTVVGAGNAWANPSGMLSTSVYASVVNTALQLQSQTLEVQNFSFIVPATDGVTGIGVTFIAYTTTSTTLTVQLLKAGVPVGNSKVATLANASSPVLLGGNNDTWGIPWTYSDLNNTKFGVQITANGIGTTYAKDLDIVAYVTSALENFNWIDSYEQNNDSLFTLALDAAGNLWKEDVNNAPGVLSLALTGILPGSFAKGATMNNSEFITFSDLTSGTDRPRQLFSDGNFYPVTQVGPGVAPTVQASTGSIGGTLLLTNYSQAGQVGTFTFTTVASAPTTDSLYVIAGTGTALDNQVVIVLSGATTSTFTADVKGTIASGDISGTATPQFFYAISSITQIPADGSGNPYIHQAPQLGFLLGAGPASGGTGTTVTVWYNVYGFPAWSALVTAMASSTTVPVFLYLTNAVHGSYNFNGIWQVTAIGQAYYPGTSNTGAYFCFTYIQSGSLSYTNISGASAFLTAAKMTLATPVDSLPAGTQITITGVTGTPQTGWNNTWTISSAVNNGQFDIDTTAYNYTTNLATYQYHQAGTSESPAVAGSLVTIIGCTNNAGFNGTFVINTATASSFTVLMQPPLPAGIAAGATVDNQGQAVMFGTVFTLDPGETFVGKDTNVNYGVATNGQITIIGSSFVPIGAGTRQAICFFITETGAWTPASPPITFTIPTDANLLSFSSIPIGSPNVVKRGIAITGAGANGVPGANFYVITEPVINTVGTTTTTYSSTIINDNVSTSAAFSFTDAVLLNSQEVDIPGFNLFNLVELGSCGWCVPYASRMFYGLQLNKVQNFNNLSFDGGSLTPLSSSTPAYPAGWQTLPTANELSLVNSPVTGTALYINNTTGQIQSTMGMLLQTAYQDPYKVAILSPNTAYSVRVSCSCPSGIRLGTLVIDLTDYSGGAFGTTYGSFTVPLANMTSLVSGFSGLLLSQGIFTTGVSSNVQLRVYVQNMGIGADVLIDRIEVYPTTFPYLKTAVYGSYVFKPEWVDASGDGGIIETATENPQTCFGGFVLRDSLYLLKTSSFYSTKDNPNSEPGGWSLREVSDRVGACGINAYDSGEEWAILGCRNGLYGFDGGEPELLNLETLQIWNAINWSAGNSIVIRNDIENRRIYCAVPLPTGTSPAGVATTSTQWLPYAPYNPAPTTPNVILMLNYQAIGSFKELMADIGTH